MTTRNSSVVAVTVTYGDRRSLLRRALSAMLDQVDHVVVVDNGATWDVNDLAREFGPDALQIIRLPQNSGSAFGYAAGLQRALEIGAEMIWLLDDDNEPARACLDNLMREYTSLLPEVGSERLAVLAFRPEHQSDVAAGVPLARVNPRESSFRGFHVLDIPFKVWRRVRVVRKKETSSSVLRVPMKVAPYSGLLFHSDVIRRYGTPRKDFVLYADDTEFTHRLTRDGGRIFLIPAALIHDLESSWNARDKLTTSFSILLRQGSNLRAYYGVRNEVYLDFHCYSGSKLFLCLNAVAFLSILHVIGVCTGRLQRLKVVRQALWDGLLGRLGINNQFPLP